MKAWHGKIRRSADANMLVLRHHRRRLFRASRRPPCRAGIASSGKSCFDSRVAESIAFAPTSEARVPSSCSIVRPPAMAGSPAPRRSPSKAAPSSTAPMSRRRTARPSPRSRRSTARSSPMSPIAARPTSTARLRSARRAFESGVWRDADPARKKKVLLRFAELIREHGEELALLGDARRRQADRQCARRRRPVLRQLHPVLRRARRQAHRRNRAGRRERRGDGAEGAARRRRRDRAVELSAHHRRLEARAGAGRGQFGRAEAGRAVAARRAAPGPARQGGGAAGRRAQRRARLRRKGRASRSRSIPTST